MLYVACVNVGNYLGRGKEYVAKLRGGVARNTRGGEYKFVELTDGGWSGWWNKIGMFKPDLFPRGSRVLYFDLDTVIVDTLSDLMRYSGEFAMLSDFYKPDLPASGVMAWRVSEQTENIYNMWEAAGFPQFDPRGDGPFIGSLIEHDRLQDIYPDRIVSLKVHCEQGVPKGASVVCFHGLPRPHHLAGIMNEW